MLKELKKKTNADGNFFLSFINFKQIYSAFSSTLSLFLSHIYYHSLQVNTIDCQMITSKEIITSHYRLLYNKHLSITFYCHPKKIEFLSSLPFFAIFCIFFTINYLLFRVFTQLLQFIKHLLPLKKSKNFRNK